MTPVEAHERIREDVVAEWDPRIVSPDIAVAVKGFVALSGTASSYFEMDAAEKAVKRVYGVRAVANDLEVKPAAARTDAEIAHDAFQAL